MPRKTVPRGKNPRQRPQLFVGVDTGGTFTDIVCQSPEGLLVLKVPSTRDDPAGAVISGLREIDAILARDGSPGRAQQKLITHGSTVATNTILERKGARTLFLTTAGFGDLIEIGRQNRPELYDLEVKKVEPLVPDSLRLEIAERILPSGKAETPLDVRALDRALSRLGSRFDAIAVGFLFSYLNPAHERAVERQLKKTHPDVPVTLSSNISPEMREYERFSTAILNAYVAPRMRHYLGELRRQLPGSEIEIMGSGGGTVLLDRARREPVQTVLSGPAAGVLGARDVAREVGSERIITFDMGGTSTDVSLVDGELSYRSESEIGGLPFRIPMIDVHTVGAGGGSIARRDAGGGLRVGPESAGADPGPVVYGRGRDLTVTDAHVCLGHLGAESFLGGKMQVFPERVRPIVEKLARSLRLDPIDLARGVLSVVNAEMERAIRVVSQERGYDPRDFTLVSYGGASGLHAAQIARQLLIARVLVPPHPGMLCARGMLTAKRVRWRSRTLQSQASKCSPEKLAKVVEKLKAEAARDFPGVPDSAIDTHIELDLRFEGQSHVLTRGVSISRRRNAVRAALAGYEATFRGDYRERFGDLDETWPVEIVALRVSLSQQRLGSPPRKRQTRRSTRPKPQAKRAMVLEGSRRRIPVPVYWRDDLAGGFKLRGPAVIAEYSGTTLVPEDFRMSIDGKGNLMLEKV